MAVAPQRTAQGSPSVLVEPGSHASAGQDAVLRVHARNISGQAQDFRVSVVGLEGSWLPTPVAVPGVPADATATFELTLMPPVGAAPGDYPFVVSVEASTAPSTTAGAPATTIADGSLRIDGVSDLVLTVEPADSQALRRRKVQVVLANTGDQPVRVRLDAAGDSELMVDLEDGDLDVGPHQTVRIPGSLRATRPRIVGHARRTAFHVTATGARAPQRFDGTVSLRAVFTPALLRFVALTMVAVLWVVGVLAVLPWVSDQFSDSDKTATAPTPPPTSGTDGNGGGTGTDGSGSDPQAGADGAQAAPDVRVSGLVTGSEPSGVVVSVQPASALSTTSSTSATPPATAAGIEKAVTALADPDRAIVTAVLGTGRKPAGAGKVLSTSLPVERTDQISQRRSTVTEDNGVWAFADLSPTARYLIVLAKPGYQTQRFLVTGAQAAAAPMKLAMVPGKGTMSGRITGPAGAVGGVEVTLSDGTTTVTTRTATSGRVGYWEVDGLSTPSTYLVSASGDKLGAQSTLVTLGAAGKRTVDLALRPGVATLSGTARGIDSLGGFGGLGGLTITASAGEITRTATTVTGDRAGTFVLPDLPVPASYTVTVSGDGYATQTRQIDLTSAGISPLDIAMTSIGGTVQGTVTEPGGHGIAAVGLVLDGPAGTYKTMSASDADGTFRFSGIAPGEYVLTAVAFGHEPASSQVTVVSGGSATVDLVLPIVPGDGIKASSFIRGSVHDASTGGQITCPDGPKGEPCIITISAEVKDPVTGIKSTVSVPHGDPDSDYTFPDKKISSGLLPGFYRLTISAPGYESGHVNVTVPMGQVVDAAPVALEQSPSIVGTVQARVGTLPSTDTTCVVAVKSVTGVPGVKPTGPCTETGPVGDKVCTIVPVNGCSFLGTNGSFAINRLQAGTYDVWVLPSAGSEFLPPEKGAVSLVPGSSRRFDAILDRYGVLNVVVMKSDGSPQLTPDVRATVTTNPPSQLVPPPPTAVTDATGSAQIRGLAPNGDLVVTSSGTSGTATRHVAIGLNQEITVQMVVTTLLTNNVDGAVKYQRSAGTSLPVPLATVQVTGTTGYVNLDPVRSTGVPDAVTTSPGGLWTLCVTIDGCPGKPAPTRLRLIGKQVDVRVTHPAFEEYRANDVPVDSLSTIMLTPKGVKFHGTVAFDPALLPGDVETTLADVRFDVLSAPPGTGEVSLTAAVVNGTPTVIWTDTKQPADGTNGATLILPGRYELTATLPGYDKEPANFTIEPSDAPDTAMAPITFTMRKFGFLRVHAMTLQTPTVGITGATMTLSLPGGLTQQIEAHPGDTFVDFGDLPKGLYKIAVKAPGYRGTTADVNVASGQTTEAPEHVDLVKLGAVHGVVKSRLTVGWTEDLPGARVTVKQVGGETFTGVTDAEGAFRVTGTAERYGLNEGAWSITTTAPGHSDGASAIDVPVVESVSPPSALEIGLPGLLPGDPSPPIEMQADLGDLQVFAVDGEKPKGQQEVDFLDMQITYRDAVNEVSRPADCYPGIVAPGCSGASGLYIFKGVLPLTYNLSISGGGYSPLTLPVVVAPGELKQITVPITTPAGSVQGVVLRQAATGGTTVVPGAKVGLKSTEVGATEKFVTADSQGHYEFPSVPAGIYQVSTSIVNGPSISRTVKVLAGQGLVVDLVLQDVTRQVVVTVRSERGTDLSGALVSIAHAGTVGPAAQPVVRTAPGANTYSTTFNQVPAVGLWGISVSGPSGHLGTTTGSVDVVAPDPGVDPVPIPALVSVTETQIALRATTTLTPGPTTVTAQIKQGTGATATSYDVVAFVGGGDTVVFVPAAATTVIAAPTGNPYPVTVTGGTIAATDSYKLVKLDVVGRATTTTGSDADTTVDPGGTFHASGQVAPTTGTGTVTGGNLQLEWLSSAPNGWTPVGSTAVADGSKQALTAPVDDAWGTGTVTLRVAYEGAGVWLPSSSTPSFTVTVRTPTQIALSPGPVTTTVTATITPSTTGGRVDFFWDDNSAVSGCGNRTVTASGTAVCTFTQPKADTKIYAKTDLSTTTWIPSTSDKVDVTGTG